MDAKVAQWLLLAGYEQVGHACVADRPSFSTKKR